MNELVDTNTYNKSNNWIEHLALEELNMEESGVVNFNAHLDPNVYLEESSINLMSRLRELFEIYIEKFNEYRGTSGAIKTFKIANTVNDFMLFRNSLRLLISRKSNDTIALGFLSSNGEVYGARSAGETSFSKGAHELKAHVGPFNKITWRYSGEIVELDSIVRHYLSEFIRNSAR